MSEAAWKVLVVDDEPDVVEVTAIVFDGLEVEGRSVEVLRAYSGKAAIEAFTANPDIAAAYLDVVMETEHAGLDVVRHVREVLLNPYVRLILRTGNPGLAAREEIVKHLDIDDYREKQDLTAERLEISLLTTLRTFQKLSAFKAGCVKP